MVAAVQLDQGPMNTRQLRMQLIGSVVLGQDGVNGFGRGGDSGTPLGGGWGVGGCCRVVLGRERLRLDL